MIFNELHKIGHKMRANMRGEKIVKNDGKYFESGVRSKFYLSPERMLPRNS